VTSDELLDRIISFAARVGKVVDAVPDTRLGRHVAGQLVRCGTSPAANYAEACAAESTNDFIHKLSIALKELRETRTWLLLIVRADLLPATKLADLIDESIQLASILGRSIATAKERKDDKPNP
jgi:four helix bundle protein